MAHRLEPFRDYSEHEVINLFALDIANLKKLNAAKNGNEAASIADMKHLALDTASKPGGNWDSGVCVYVSGGDLPLGVPSEWDKNADMRAYLGHAHTDAHIGWNAMPSNKMLVRPSAGGISDKSIGITLRQTLAYDENGENLLRYPVKKDELQAVGPGETVPILTRGLVILNKYAFTGETLPTQGVRLEVATGAGAGALSNDFGKLKPADADLADEVAAADLAAGQMPAHTPVHNFEPDVGICLAVDSAGGKALCKLSF